MDDDGQFCTETAELWFRDPVECVKELIGNPAFKAVMDYAPKRLFVDAEGTEEVIDEMSTASWWWKMQVRNRWLRFDARTHKSMFRHGFQMARPAHQ